MSIPGPREWSKNQSVVPHLVTLTAAKTQVLPYNADRVSLLISNAIPAGSQIWVDFGGVTAANQGIPFGTNAPALVLSFAQHGDLVKQAVFAAVPAGAGPIYLVETLWLPQVE